MAASFRFCKQQYLFQQRSKAAPFSHKSFILSKNVGTKLFGVIEHKEFQSLNSKFSSSKVLHFTQGNGRDPFAGILNDIKSDNFEEVADLIKEKASSLPLLPNEFYKMLVEKSKLPSLRERVTELFLKLPELGAKNIPTWALNIVMFSATRNNREQVMPFYSFIQKNGIPMEAQTVVTLISCLAANRHTQHIAKEVFEHANKNNIQILPSAYNSALFHYARTNNTEYAIDLFYELRAENKPICLTSYNSLLRNFGRNRNWLNMMEAFQDMSRSGIEPDMNTYKEILSSVGKTRDKNVVKSTWTKIRTLLPQEFPIEYWNLLRPVLSDFHPAEVIALWGKVPEPQRVLDSKSITILLNANFRLKSKDKVMELWTLVSQDIMKYDETTWANFAKVFAAWGERPSLDELLEHLLEKKVSPSCQFYRNLAYGFSLRYDRDGVNEVIALMHENNVQKDFEFYRAMVSIFMNLGMTKEKEEMEKEFSILIQVPE